jgi:hypothetical protein
MLLGRKKRFCEGEHTMPERETKSVAQERQQLLDYLSSARFDEAGL